MQGEIWLLLALALLESLHEQEQHAAGLRKQIEGHCERIAKQADQLSQNAARRGDDLAQLAELGERLATDVQVQKPVSTVLARELNREIARLTGRGATVPTDSA